MRITPEIYATGKSASALPARFFVVRPRRARPGPKRRCLLGLFPNPDHNGFGCLHARRAPRSFGQPQCRRADRRRQSGGAASLVAQGPSRYMIPELRPLRPVRPRSASGRPASPGARGFLAPRRAGSRSEARNGPPGRIRVAGCQSSP